MYEMTTYIVHLNQRLNPEYETPKPVRMCGIIRNKPT
jgi:hypothetical protein